MVQLTAHFYSIFYGHFGQVTGLGIPVLQIEGVRAHASAISAGALAVFVFFSKNKKRSISGLSRIRQLQACGKWNRAVHVQCSRLRSEAELRDRVVGRVVGEIGDTSQAGRVNSR